MDSKQFSVVAGKIGKEIKNTLLHKKVGFFVGLASLVMAIAAMIVYAVSYGSTAYYDGVAVGLCATGAVLFVLASLSHYSSPFASVVLAAGSFAGFLLFINATYMYLADVFYGGINATSFAALSKEYIACFLLFLLSAIVANVAVYMKQDKIPDVQNADEKNDASDETLQEVHNED